VHGSRQLQ
jgi:hypothetical protein